MLRLAELYVALQRPSIVKLGLDAFKIAVPFFASIYLSPPCLRVFVPGQSVGEILVLEARNVLLVLHSSAVSKAQIKGRHNFTA